MFDDLCCTNYVAKMRTKKGILKTMKFKETVQPVRVRVRVAHEPLSVPIRVTVD